MGGGGSPKDDELGRLREFYTVNNNKCEQEGGRGGKKIQDCLWASYVYAPLLELVRPVRARVVHRALQVLQLVRVDHERLEVVVAVGVVDRALQRSDGCRIAKLSQTLSVIVTCFPNGVRVTNLDCTV